ncbi:MAG: hypothetical protein OXG35_09570 [Acidobacteria bacterium]|nr:hypothetical protein [Acidobacteriota bacterium]
MIARENLTQVRRNRDATRDLVTEVFSGEYHSVFNGPGMNFAAVRDDHVGNDIRNTCRTPAFRRAVVRPTSWQRRGRRETGSSGRRGQRDGDDHRRGPRRLLRTDANRGAVADVRRVLE